MLDNHQELDRQLIHVEQDNIKPSIFFADLVHTYQESRTFPLGIGCVAAYAKQQFGDRFEYRLFKLADRLNEELKVSVPQVMCFSNFIWNSRLTHEFARHIKQIAPETVIVFGGPNFPQSSEGRRDYLRNHPHVDFYIKWEGELPFVELVRALTETDFNPEILKRDRPLITNCCYLVENDVVESPDERVHDLSSLPSPYLTGLLDEFFEEKLDVLFETSRGCPYACTFCNDGHKNQNKVFMKPTDVIRDELHYIADRVRPGADLHLSDLNYGMYQKDLETSRLIRTIIDEHGWPKRIISSIGKSHPDRCLEAVDIINGSNEGIFKFGASFQSTDAQVLRNIKRKNLPYDRLAKLRNFNSPEFSNLEYFTELILPLPGDTLESHAESLRLCIDDLHMNNIDVHQLCLLPGTEMAEMASRETYKFDVRYRVFIGCMGIYEIGDKTIPCSEIEEIVVGTESMSFDDYVEGRVLDLLVKVFIDHNLFEEIFGLIECMGLSLFRLIQYLKDKNLHLSGILSELIEEFIRDTEAPLYKNLHELEDRVSRVDVVKKYISGELGRNEILKARSKAYMEYESELHEALQDAALFYLDEVGRSTPTLRSYIKEASKFSELRKIDPRSLNEERYGTFTFDFVSAQEKQFRVDPETIRTQPTHILFEHTDNGLELIKRTLAKWTVNHTVNYRKFFQKENLKVMAREGRHVHELLAKKS